MPRRLAASTQTHTREFSLLDEADRELVVSMYRGAQALSELPHPY